MNPTELTSLFGANKQTLLIATEPKRLAEMSEDELADLHKLVRKARNKYSGLHRRQGKATVEKIGRRAATQSQNLRTLRKAEIFEDALARTSRALSVAARKSALELKSERLALAGAATSAPKKSASAPTSTRRSAPGDNTTREARGVTKGGRSTPARQSSSKAQGARRQAKRDAR
jgi:hypothetical protein